MGIYNTRRKIPKLLDFFAFLWAIAPPQFRKFYYRINCGISIGSSVFPDCLVTVSIKRGIIKGMKMRFNLNRERTYYFGTYEKEVQSVLSLVCRDGMNAFNIGANVGFYTLSLSKLVGPKGFVVAFEPNPNARDILIKNIDLNKLGDFIRVEESALSDFDGYAKFSLSLNDARCRFEDLPDVKPGFDIQVPCRRLDTYISEEQLHPDFIVMDVEYAEGRVLRGMDKILKKHKPIIIIEMHSSDSIEEAWIELKKHDYFLASIPTLKIISNLGDMNRGHYLSSHISRIKEIEGYCKGSIQ